jgi:hypothetical protein
LEAILDCVSGGDGDVVEQAEPHRAIGSRVMTGRPGDHKGAIDLIIQDGVDGHNRGAGGEPGHVHRFRADDGIGIDPATTGCGDGIEMLEQRGRVDTVDRRVRSRYAGNNRATTKQAAPLQFAIDRDDPGRSFRMVARIVFEK